MEYVLIVSVMPKNVMYYSKTFVKYFVTNFPFFSLYDAAERVRRH